MSRNSQKTTEIISKPYKQKLSFNCNYCNHSNEFQITVKPLKHRKSDNNNNSQIISNGNNNNNNSQVNNNDNENYQLNNLTTSIPEINFPLCVEVKHRGFWITNEYGMHISTTDVNCERNSVIFTNDCLLYVYKLALRHLLLSIHTITPGNIDAANLVPHMVVRKNKTDPFSKYDWVQNKKFIISEQMISIKNDFMLIEVDESKDLHFTLIYCKKIKNKVDLLRSFKIVVNVLNQYPELITEYSNLDYFGQDVIDYWYNVPESFPFSIMPPSDYRPITQSVNYPTTTAADQLHMLQNLVILEKITVKCQEHRCNNIVYVFYYRGKLYDFKCPICLGLPIALNTDKIPAGFYGVL